MNENKPQVYGVKHRKLDVRMNSRSGGIFTALSDYVLEKQGVIYGCVLNESFSAVHCRATTKSERDLMRGSKYVQSNMLNSYNDIKDDLEDDKIVLFSGTSCQVAGLKRFLQKDYENLYCVDIVCHGVPSPLIWNDYLNWLEKKKKGKVVAVDFRNKKDFGWNSHFETITVQLDDGTEEKVNAEIFKTLFYEHNILRPSCFKCPYKAIVHPGDITIADYWGIEKAAPGFDDNRGVSLVLINNEKGRFLFEQANTDLEIKETDIKNSMQPPLIAPFPKPESREKFWEDYFGHEFGYIVDKYGGTGWRYQIRRIKNGVKRRVKMCFKLKVCDKKVDGK